jgi:hypothetical protein
MFYRCEIHETQIVSTPAYILIWGGGEHEFLKELMSSVDYQARTESEWSCRFEDRPWPGQTYRISGGRDKWVRNNHEIKTDSENPKKPEETRSNPK